MQIPRGRRIGSDDVWCEPDLIAVDQRARLDSHLCGHAHVKHVGGLQTIERVLNHAGLTTRPCQIRRSSRPERTIVPSRGGGQESAAFGRVMTFNLPLAY